MRLFDTYTKSLVDLPAPPGPIRMYVCGPTVYARAHIGNARPFVVGMWFRAWLRARGYDVTLVHNITDVNDKIYDAAPGASAELAERATQWYLEDVGDLGLGLPDAMPKATESIDGIETFIERLVDAGFAYAVGGDVYFRVAGFSEYGRLSGQRPDQVEQGEEPNPLKEDPRDFALWKATKPGEDTSWESPWGRGRPGWHIECSAMAEEELGEEFEIHGGGLDLVFPHHENELAQSRALGHGFARIWAHNGMLRFTGEKMSKSLGNVTTIREALDEWGKERLLMFFLSGHWRQPIDFSTDTMVQAGERLRTIRDSLVEPPEEPDFSQWNRLEAALDDDFDTPKALEVIHEWASTGQQDLLRRALGLFGITLPSFQELRPSYGLIRFLGGKPAEEVFELVKLRHEARIARDFSRADEAREQILGLGWEVRDIPGGYLLVRPGRVPSPSYEPLW